MAFSFDPSLSDYVSIIRFHIGDTKVEGYFIEDETIEYLYNQNQSVGEAVIASIKFILSRLSQPDYRTDWLSISGMDRAREGFRQLLKDKSAEFGVSINGSSFGSSISYPYRADSLQDEETEYDGS